MASQPPSMSSGHEALLDRRKTLLSPSLYGLPLYLSLPQPPRLNTTETKTRRKRRRITVRDGVEWSGDNGRRLSFFRRSLPIYLADCMSLILTYQHLSLSLLLLVSLIFRLYFPSSLSVRNTDRIHTNIPQSPPPPPDADIAHPFTLPP